MQSPARPAPRLHLRPDPPIVAILRAAEPTHLADVAMTLHEAGITAAEFTLTTPGALDALRECRRAAPESLLLGAGSVRTVEDARRACDAGAEFLVTPAARLDVIAESHALAVPIAAGAATPTEVLAAWQAGASVVKVFPAGQLGGPAYLRALRGPFPDIALLPTGGVEIESAADYLAAGACGLGMGAPLLGDACRGGSLPALRERAAALLEALRG